MSKRDNQFDSNLNLNLFYEYMFNNREIKQVMKQ